MSGPTRKQDYENALDVVAKARVLIGSPAAQALDIGELVELIKAVQKFDRYRTERAA